MSHFTIVSENTLLARDANGACALASIEDILEAVRRVIDHKLLRDGQFTSPTAVKEYLQVKLAGLEYEVFAVLLLNNQHRLNAYREMFRGTIDCASVHPRE